MRIHLTPAARLLVVTALTIAPLTSCRAPQRGVATPQGAATPLPELPDYSWSNLAAAIENLPTTRPPIRALSADVTVETGGSPARSWTGTLVVSPPGPMRLTLREGDRVVFDLLGEPRTFRLLHEPAASDGARPEHDWLSGSPSSGMPVDPRYLYAMLKFLSSTHASSAVGRPVAEDDREFELSFRISSGTLRRRIDKRTRVDRRVTLMGARVEPLATLELDDYAMVDGVPLPRTWSFAGADGGGAIRLILTSPVVNQAPADDAFRE